MDHPALSPEQIIAEFQRRRRLTFRIRKWTAGLGLGGLFGGMLLLRSLHDLQYPPYWLFAGMAAALGIFVFGAFFTPHLYRCPRCGLRVRAPDPTEAGYTLIKDPVSCPHCGAILKREATRGCP